MSTKKLSLAQAQELFKELGLQNVDVVDNAEDADTDVDLVELAASIKPEPVEPVDVGKAISQHTGKLMGSLYSEVARTFGLKRSELEGLSEKDLMQKAKTSFESRYTGVESTLRSEVESLTQQLNDLDEAKTKEWQSKLDMLEKDYQEKDVLTHFLSTYNNVPTRGGNKAELAEMALMKAKAKYDVKWNKESGQVEFYDKNDSSKRIINGKDALNANSFIAEFNKNIGNDATGTNHIEPTEVLNNKNLNAGIKNQNASDMQGDKYQQGVSKLLQQVEEKIAEQ